MRPTQMGRHKIIRIILVLFMLNQVVDFVFGAPVAVREKLGPINADETDDGRAVSQRRVNVEEGSTNMAGQTRLSSEANRIWQEMAQLSMDLEPRRIPPPRPEDNPTPPPLPRPPTPPPPTLFPPFRPFRPVVLSAPVPPIRAHFPLSPYPPLTIPPTTPPPLAEGRLQSASSSAAHNPSPSTTGHQLTPQQNPGPDLDVHPPLNPEPRPIPNSGQPSPNQEPHPLPNPEPHSPPNPEQPRPNPGPHPSTSGEVDEVLDMLKNGRIKRTFPAPVQ